MRFARPSVTDCSARAFRIAALALPLIFAAPHPSAAGEGSATNADTLQDLRKALEEEKERIRVLEQRLAAETAGNAAPPSAPSAAASNAAPPSAPSAAAGN